MDLRRLLAAVEESAPIDAVDVLAAELAEMVDASHVSLLIADFSGSTVVRLSHVTSSNQLRNGRNERVETLPLTDSPYHRVLFTQNLEASRNDDDWLVLLPVTERGDAIGILELSLPSRPDAETVDYLVAAAHALAYVLIASRRHTDLFEWAQRDIPFSLAAEIQRRLLPSAYTAEGGSFTIAGWLEPSHDAGGDTFDYSVDREYLYASITDAMGHSTQAALLATLTVGSLRNRRRALASPAEQADIASNVLASGARGTSSSPAAHPRSVSLTAPPNWSSRSSRPYLLRAGRATKLDVTTDVPLGVQTGHYTGPDPGASARRSALAGHRRLPGTQRHQRRCRANPGGDHRASSQTDRSGTRSQRPAGNQQEAPRRRNRSLYRLDGPTSARARQRWRQPSPRHRLLDPQTWTPRGGRYRAGGHCPQAQNHACRINRFRHGRQGIMIHQASPVEGPGSATAPDDEPRRRHTPLTRKPAPHLRDGSCADQDPVATSRWPRLDDLLDDGTTSTPSDLVGGGLCVTVHLPAAPPHTARSAHDCPLPRGISK